MCEGNIIVTVILLDNESHQMKEVGNWNAPESSAHCMPFDVIHYSPDVCPVKPKLCETQ